MILQYDCDKFHSKQLDFNYLLLFPCLVWLFLDSRKNLVSLHSRSANVNKCVDKRSLATIGANITNTDHSVVVDSFFSHMIISRIAAHVIADNWIEYLFPASKHIYHITNKSICITRKLIRNPLINHRQSNE